jgi:hypothetical protein
MINDITDYVTSILVGIRYQPNFGFTENSGAMFDDILYGKNSKFDTQFFPKVNTGVKDRTLYDDERGNVLRVDTQNVIFDYQNEDFEELQKVIKNFKDQIFYDKLVKFKLTRIRRLGVIYRYIIPDGELSNALINNTIDNQITGINDITLKFSKKKFDKSMIVKGEYDYQNVIYNINKEADSNELAISIDFQCYYSPLLQETSQIDFDNLLKIVNRYNRISVKDWLNKRFIVV